MTAIASRASRLAILLVATMLASCASLPRDVVRPESHAVALDPDDGLGRLARQVASTEGLSSFRPLPQSAYAMDARLTLIRHARRALDLQYYLLQNDVTGHKLLAAVRDAAQRGVRVRVLVDDLYTADSDQMLIGLAAFPNVEVRLFNPFPAGRFSAATRWILAAGDFSRVNHRMHNKLLIADGAFAVAGGRNIADEYFFGSKGGNFVDFDLLVAGDAVPRLSHIFDVYWNSPRVFPLSAVETASGDPVAVREGFDRLVLDAKDAYPVPSADARDLLGFRTLSVDLMAPPLKMWSGRITVFADDPEKVGGHSERGDDPGTVTARVGAAIANARSSVLIGSPYFIPGKPGLAGLEAARSHGVVVDVMTNSLASNDEPFASAAYGRYRVAMLRMGVNLYETDSSQLRDDPLIGQALGATIGRSHSKLIVIDRHLTFVGSMNMDLRSSRVNTELGMLVDSTELAGAILALADRVRTVGSYRLQLGPSGDRVQWIGREHGRDVVLDDEPGVDFWTRTKVWMFAPLISEGLL